MPGTGDNPFTPSKSLLRVNRHLYKEAGDMMWHAFDGFLDLSRLRVPINDYDYPDYTPTNELAQEPYPISSTYES